MVSEQLPLADRAIQIIADSKFLAAMDAGEFDNLPGLPKVIGDRGGGNPPRHLIEWPPQRSLLVLHHVTVVN